MSKVKICGLKRTEDIAAVNMAKPDYIGFMFYEKSKRFVTVAKACELYNELDHDIKAVGVFVNSSIDTILEIISLGIIDVVQLHGSEDEEYIKTLRSNMDLPVIKAFKVESNEDALKACASSADYILLDSGPGGTGMTFDWSLLEGVNREYFLAGGMSPDNVSGAVKNLKPYAVDVSSGVETDGLKDKDKIINFVDIVRQSDV